MNPFHNHFHLKRNVLRAHFCYIISVSEAVICLTVPEIILPVLECLCEVTCLCAVEDATWCVFIGQKVTA